MSAIDVLASGPLLGKVDAMRGTYTISALFCIAVSALSPGYPAAADGDAQTCPGKAFLVRGVEVSASAGSGSEARAVATQQGLEQAWRSLAGRLLLEGGTDQGGDAAGADAVLDDMVDHIRVVNETVLSQRYIATFDYCFDRGKIRAHFAGLGARHAELVSAPMLVLPVWNGGGGARIWRRPNPWVEAWEEVLEGRDGLVTLRLPQSLAVERAVSPEAAREGRRETLARAAGIEEAEKVIVTVMTPRVEGDTMTVSVSAGLHGRGGVLESVFYDLDSHSFAVDSAEESMLWLAGQIAEGIERVWRDVNAVALEETAPAFALRIPADDIAEWRGMVDRLRSLSPVERVGVLQLARGGGVVRVELSSSMQSFVYALEAEGLAIDRRTGGDGAVTLALIPRNG